MGPGAQEPWDEVAGRQAEVLNEKEFSPRAAAQKLAASWGCKLPGPESLPAKEHS